MSDKTPDAGDTAEKRVRKPRASKTADAAPAVVSDASPLIPARPAPAAPAPVVPAPAKPAPAAPAPAAAAS
ncbi:transcription termination factor Rho, partial [Lysobacter capsici]